MIEKKICMLGSFAVGKTSLVRRFVESIFTEIYHTTIGVKIDKKVVHVDGTEVKLVLWDLYGEDGFQKMHWSYVHGSSGYLLVADGTRRATLEKAVELEQRVREEAGPIPFVFIINKCDLIADWELEPEMEARYAAMNWTVLHSSAKTGEGVEEAFSQLTRKMLV
jgi:small GTP-binding protein